MHLIMCGFFCTQKKRKGEKVSVRKQNKKVVQILENLLEEKQNNGTIKNIAEEMCFLCGGIAMIHELTKHENNDENSLECYPPKYFVAMARNESINEFNYNEGETNEM